jgi:hypothetical protein
MQLIHYNASRAARKQRSTPASAAIIGEFAGFADKV